MLEPICTSPLLAPEYTSRRCVALVETAHRLGEHANPSSRLMRIVFVGVLSHHHVAFVGEQSHPRVAFKLSTLEPIRTLPLSTLEPICTSPLSMLETICTSPLSGYNCIYVLLLSKAPTVFIYFRF
jgi:hypothetical protein